MAPSKVAHFKPERTWTFDSLWLARGILAASSFVDKESPVYQFDLHPTGAIIIGTDKHSLIIVTVPRASGEGYDATRSQAFDGWMPSGDPERVITARDGEGTLLRWARFYGKVGRLKDTPIEHAVIESGPRANDVGPMVLGAEVEMRSVRFAGDLEQTIIDDTCTGGVGWRKLLDSIDGAEPAGKPARFQGSSADAIGGLGRLDPERIVVCQTVVTANGFEAITIDVPGSFPRASGYCAAAR